MIPELEYLKKHITMQGDGKVVVFNTDSATTSTLQGNVGAIVIDTGSMVMTLRRDCCWESGRFHCLLLCLADILRGYHYGCLRQAMSGMPDKVKEWEDDWVAAGDTEPKTAIDYYRSLIAALANDSDAYQRGYQDGLYAAEHRGPSHEA